MSDHRDHGNGPNEGEKKEEKGKNIAQEVGAATINVHGNNISKHAEAEEEWMALPSGGRKSKLFGIHEIPDSQENEEDMALTLSEAIASAIVSSSLVDMEVAGPCF